MSGLEQSFTERIGRMSTKHTDTCLQKAEDDEPIFVLLARDLSAPELVESWVEKNPQISAQKKVDALACARAMRDWRGKKKIAD